MSNKQSINVGKYIIELSNEDKILFPKSKITKGDLINYYDRIAPVMIPYVKDRPLTMRRFPDGIATEGFYQKDIPDYFPSWIKSIAIKKSQGGTTAYVLCNHDATLVYIANQASIEQHIWLSRVSKLNYPDRMIFDLDPSGKASFTLVKWTAKTIKKLLDDLELTVFVMTTGSRGLHVVVPLKPVESYARVKNFAQEIAQYLVEQYPDKLTREIRKNKRGNRIFLDTLRNDYGHHGVAPYSVRAKEGAPIATPIEWNELVGLSSAQKFTIKNIFSRLSKKKDPWHIINKHTQTLTNARKKLKKIKGD
ncbi:MAG TPA: non-homologous end-joining DNA ligase [Candidatus Dependentiae bacterium]|nr:non-homologous end-joining DNA ligase [Candidatus Dependentiae bacterium]HRQ63158.1 non-homologous end-joining DNA ligase [Candidatus Dependentiae bacterium]